ncbi:hypothetical protein B0T13DRAFT_174222 [Neurospora crassa]|nr:hypothetical protein B0T13DRAFT_174222 [Neurospora crassa]
MAMRRYTWLWFIWRVHAYSITSRQCPVVHGGSMSTCAFGFISRGMKLHVNIQSSGVFLWNPRKPCSPWLISFKTSQIQCGWVKCDWVTRGGGITHPHCHRGSGSVCRHSLALLPQGTCMPTTGAVRPSPIWMIVEAWRLYGEIAVW